MNANGATSTFGYVLAVRAEAIPAATPETEPNDDGTPFDRQRHGQLRGQQLLPSPPRAAPSAPTRWSRARSAPTGDEDVFAISNTGAGPAEVYLETFNGGFGACTTGLDTQIRIRDASGAVLAFADDAGTGRFCSFLPYVIPAGHDRVRARHRLRRQHDRRRVFAARQLSVDGSASNTTRDMLA